MIWHEYGPSQRHPHPLLSDHWQLHQSGSGLSTKGQGWLSSVWRLSHPSTGTSPQVMHHLYISTAVPHMLYAANVWAQPPDLSQTPFHTPAQLVPLAQIHCQSALLITGAM
ncbi:hypothetical protein BDQ17DRAFT_1242871 [Cyathus striatus]|nr:hypothetical protein BDQ17DRAFT_1242871 [Cyathus striatus]